MREGERERERRRGRVIGLLHRRGTTHFIFLPFRDSADVQSHDFIPRSITAQVPTVLSHMNAHVRCYVAVSVRVLYSHHV